MPTTFFSISPIPPSNDDAPELLFDDDAADVDFFSASTSTQRWSISSHTRCADIFFCAYSRFNFSALVSDTPLGIELACRKLCPVDDDDGLGPKSIKEASG